MRVLLRASSIGGDAYVTSLDAPGKPEAVATASVDRPAGAFSHGAAPLLQAAVVLKATANAKQQSAPANSARSYPAGCSHSYPPRTALLWTISDSAMLSAAMRSGAVPSQKEQRWRQQTRARRLPLPDRWGQLIVTRRRGRSVANPMAVPGGVLTTEAIAPSGANSVPGRWVAGANGMLCGVYGGPGDASRLGHEAGPTRLSDSRGSRGRECRLRRACV